MSGENWSSQRLLDVSGEKMGQEKCAQAAEEN